MKIKTTYAQHRVKKIVIKSQFRKVLADFLGRQLFIKLGIKICTECANRIECSIGKISDCMVLKVPTPQNSNYYHSPTYKTLIDL
jgi:hypothetical protein